MSTIDDLKEAWGWADTQKKKALIERALKREREKSGVSDGQQREWLCKFLGDNLFHIQVRATLIGLGDMIDPLWQRVDAGQLLVNSAAKIVGDAKRIAVDKGIPLDEAMKKALADYDRLPFLRWISGVPVRVGKPAPKGKGVKRKVPRVLASTEDPDTAFAAQIRAQVVGYVKGRLRHAPPVVIDKVTRDFVVTLKVMMGELKRNMKEAASVDETLARRSNMSRAEVVEACRALHIDPPLRDGHPVDIAIARTRYHAMAREYHPDRHDGDETKRPKYEAVCSAWALVKKYNEQIIAAGVVDGDPTGGPSEQDRS